MRHTIETALLTCVLLSTACGEQTDDGEDAQALSPGASTPNAPLAGSSPAPGTPINSTMPAGSSGGTPTESAEPTPVPAPARGGSGGFAGEPSIAAGGSPAVTPIPAGAGGADQASSVPAGEVGSGGTDSESEGAGGGGGDVTDDITMMGMGGMSGANPEPTGDFVLSSTAFMNGDDIPDEFTCEGKQFGTGPMPDLSWTPGPEGTLSYAITFIDITLAPDNMNGYHWALWDIPAEVTSLPSGEVTGAEPAEPAGSRQYTPLNPVGFLGPCPSFGGLTTDEYAFVVYALSVATIPNPPNNVAELEQLFLDNALATADLTGFSDAAPQ